ncbi:MAG: trypsin-like peptidase domain-containing protein [Sphingomonas sp.]|nr:trypsin-like peptidase domain-containing protein [Sphingomonas sp.]
MGRYLLLLAMLLAFATPARADDISAAGRSVVRVVVVAFEDGEVVGFGHGSGFAVAPNRIVTNAHVVAQAAQQQEGLNVAVGVVPSEGSQAFRARVLTVDPARDLALIEIAEGGRFPPLPLYTGPLADGAAVTALGYPGNVDLATAQSAQDYITPLPPTRSTGIFSNARTINGIATLLHTANIARGNSGGPLLDPCGRVLGVNTLITRNQEGDASFAFAVANRELTAFLQGAAQPFAAASGPCISMADRLSQDRDRAEAEERARDAAAQRARDERAEMLAAIQDSRETGLAVAALMLALALIVFGAAGVLWIKNRNRPAAILAGIGGLLIVAAIVVFLARPNRDDADAAPAREGDSAEAAPESRFAGRNLCRLVPDRSRVTLSSTDDVTLEWSDSGCVNGRTQYARAGDVWTRILVPDGEPAVSVLEFRPARGEYVVNRYQLGAVEMERVRGLRRGVDLKSCGADDEARAILTDQQREIGTALPSLPNERLVYQCENQRGD